uniref:NAD(P)-binding domain-containing protein n=1 Tax=Arundo donax TaxID=35708 RepID=A0A0A9ECY8_ARUDO
MNSKLRKLAERDEEVVLASGIPSTIIRTGSLQSCPGGERGFDFTEGIAAKGRTSKEDAATICVEALDAIPQKTLIFEVANGDKKVEDWKAWFAEQIKRDEEI